MNLDQRAANHFQHPNLLDYLQNLQKINQSLHEIVVYNDLNFQRLSWTDEIERNYRKNVSINVQIEFGDMIK